MGSLAERVREARKAAGMGQAELAARITEWLETPWTQSTVTKVETGRRPLRFDEAVAVSHELGVSLDWLAGQGATSEDALRHRLHKAEDRLERVRAAVDRIGEIIDEQDPLVLPWDG